MAIVTVVTLRDVGNFVGLSEAAMMIAEAMGYPVPRQRFQARLKELAKTVVREYSLSSVKEIAKLPSSTPLKQASSRRFRELSKWWRKIRARKP